MRDAHASAKPDVSGIALIVDAYRAHVTAEALDLCSELEIPVTVIPAAMTALLQPLDQAPFRMLKSTIHAMEEPAVLAQFIQEHDRDGKSIAATGLSIFE